MFNLHTLGWHSFQQLCLSISREILGQTVESFLDTNDGGRDGAFSGTWTTRNGESLAGRFVIQCKFTALLDNKLTISDIEDEISKVRRLVDKNECDVYVLMTNAGVSAENDLKLKKKLTDAGVKEVRIFGRIWLEDQIRESKRLRMMVPRVYGLGDLSQILDERAYAQATAVLESMREDLAKVVLTESYRRAARALDDHHFVLLVGEPASGKTTIASLLAMASADQWGASVVKLSSPDSVVKRWNPNERSQLFWVDDAFGVTQYESDLATGWNHIFNEVKALLSHGNRVVLTSRDYIYNRARQDLKEGAFPLLQESQVVIDVHDLTEDERRQMLYNHLKLGKQTQQFRSQVKPYLEGVAANDRFIPEIARRLADPFFTKKLYLAEWSLAGFVEKREQFLLDVCNELDVHSKAALALIFMRNGRLPSPIDLNNAEDEALRRLGSNLGACSSALMALRGSLVVHVLDDGESFWTFKHPTIGDAYSAILRGSPELVGIYVRGSDVEKMIRQVTCGNVGIEGAVVVPGSLFGLMIDRLSEFKKSSAYKTEWRASWEAQRELHGFLANRCNKNFLEIYLATDPQLMESVIKPVSLYLEYSPEVALAKHLFKLGLLSEDARRAFVESVSTYAYNGNDASVLTDYELRSMLNVRELTKLEHAIRTRLLPRIEQVRLEHQAGRNPENNAEWHMSRFTNLLSAIEAVYPKSWRIRKIVAKERIQVREWIDKNPTQRDNLKLRDIAVEELNPGSAVGRSIFDDIDE